MTSIRNNERSEDRYLDAARECILATGWTRTPLTDVARRAIAFATSTSERALCGRAIGSSTSGLLPRSIASTGSSASADASATSARPLNSEK